MCIKSGGGGEWISLFHGMCHSKTKKFETPLFYLGMFDLLKMKIKLKDP